MSDELNSMYYPLPNGECLDKHDIIKKITDAYNNCNLTGNFKSAFKDIINKHKGSKKIENLSMNKMKNIVTDLNRFLGYNFLFEEETKHYSTKKIIY